MPINYEINEALKLVVASATGTLTGEEMMNYQLEAWSKETVRDFDEIVDVSGVEHFDYTSPANLQELTKLSAKMDWINYSKKFAIVAPSDIAFGLARMYQSYRETDVLTRKEVQVFRSMEQARQWIGR